MLRRGWILGGLLGCGWAGLVGDGAAAQEESSVLRGRVLADVTGRPVAGVQLRFDTGQRVITDARGHFRIAGLPPGEHGVTLVTPLCQVTQGRVVVEPRMSWDTDLTLPQAMVGFQPPAEVLPDAEGVWLPASRIEAMRVRTAADALRREAPEMVSPPGTQPGRMGRLRGRNRATMSGESQPTILVDGVRTDAAVLFTLDAGDVAAIQVLEGASGGWVYGSPGGIVKVWTKRGGGARSPGTPDACTVDRVEAPTGGVGR